MAIVCPDCPQDACCHFTPKSPDPYIKKDKDMELAKFGHLNHLVDMICCISDDVAAITSSEITSVVDCDDEPVEIVDGVLTLPCVITDDTLTGNGTTTSPLSVVPGAAALLYAEYVQHVIATNGSIAPGTAVMYNTSPAPFNTAGITTATGPGAVGTAFNLPVGFYMVDWENSADAAWSLAIYKGTSATVMSIDTNTIAGSTTATTWIHGRAIVESTVGTPWIMVSPVTGTHAIPTAGTAAGEFIARITFLKIA